MFALNPVDTLHKFACLSTEHIGHKAWKESTSRKQRADTAVVGTKGDT